MRIAACLTVLDEVELIGRSIDHLRLIGADHVLVQDLGSTDGTLDILRHRPSSDLRVIQIADGVDEDVETWSHREVELARSIDADWILFLDADEFWLPASGSLRDTAALACADVLSVRRFNVPLCAAGPCMPPGVPPSSYDDVLLHTQPIPAFREYLERHPEAPWIRAVPNPKVMVRPGCLQAFTAGQHDVVAHDGWARRIVPDDLVIAHLPFTSRARFFRKVQNLGRSLDVHPKFFVDDVGWHWRRWRAQDEQGRLEEEFRRQVTSPEELSNLRARGLVRSASEILTASLPVTRGH